MQIKQNQILYLNPKENIYDIIINIFKCYFVE